MSKIGILGGSFNPIHNGHLYIARQALERCGLDQILFVPTGRAPHKDNRNFVSKQHRYEMTRLAIAGEPRFAVSDIEIQTEGVCYTVHTMAALQKQYPESTLYYIIGADSLFSILTWHRPEQLLKTLKLIVVDRDGQDIDARAGQYRRQYGADITVCHIPPVDISATEIRRAYARGRTSGGAVPAAVEQYIIKHHLFTGEDADGVSGT